MEAAAAAAMDFHALSRKELQALCKRNGVRANMTNVAMAEALERLDSVDGIDEIGTTLCLPTPGRSAMKSAAKVAAVEEQQQHGSPLPRGRRVSVKSPEAIRMEVEGGEEVGVKEIVKTPGVALRSTRRGTRATPAPLPTPAPAGSTRATARRAAARKTVEVVPTPATRRSQRTASRKAAGAVEVDRAAEDVPEEKTSMSVALEQEAEVVAAASKEEKVQEDEPKVALSDEKRDAPNEEENVQQEEPKVALSDEKCVAPNEEEKVQQEEPKAVASDVKCDDPEEADRSAEDVLEETSMSIALDQEAEVFAAASKEENVQEDEPKVALSDEKCDAPNEEEKVQQEEPKAVALDVKFDDPEEEVTKFLDGDNKEDELEEGEEADSSDATTESAAVLVKSCNDPKVEELVVVLEKQSTMPHEGSLKEQEPISVEGSAPLTVMDDSPIRGVIEEEQDAAAGEDETIEEGEDDEMPQTFETNEEDEEDYFTELNQWSADKVMQAELPLADNETSEEGEDDLSEDSETSEEDEDDLSEEGEVADVKMLDQGAADKVMQAELSETSEEDEDDLSEDNETSEEDEDDLSEEGEVADVMMLQGLMDNGTDEEDDLDEDEDWASDDENTEEIGSTGDSDEDTDETNGKSYTSSSVQMLQGTGMAEEAKEDAFEDDDFSGDLPAEFDNIMISDAETESDNASPVLKENQAAVAFANKTAKSLDDSAMNAEQEGPKEADAKEVDNIVKSLDEFTLKEEESEEMQKQQPLDYNSMSLRKLKSTYKSRLIATKEVKREEATEGKRLPLEEVDENASSNH